MIEIDGTAIPLEPGKQYLLLVNQRVSPALIDRMNRAFVEYFGVKVIVLRVDDVQDVRMIQIEQPEQVPV